MMISSGMLYYSYFLIIYFLLVFSKFSAVRTLKHYFCKIKSFNKDNNHWYSSWQQANQVMYDPCINQRGKFVFELV